MHEQTSRAVPVVENGRKQAHLVRTAIADGTRKMSIEQSDARAKGVSEPRDGSADNRREPESSCSLEVDGNRYAIGMRQRESAGRRGVPV